MTTISEIIKNKESCNMIFKPTKLFYDKVGIKQRRWGQIYRGEVSPNIIEAKSIAQFFGFEVIDLLK